jgi:hypothetical protein
MSYEGVSEGTVTLVNSSQYFTYRIGWRVQGQGSAGYNPYNYVIWFNVNEGVAEDDGYPVKGNMMLVDAIEGQTNFAAIHFVEFAETFKEPAQKAQMVKDNMAVYVETLYHHRENGTLNPETYISPVTLAQEYSTSYNSTGYYSYAIGFAAATGMAVPDTASLSTMTLSYQGKLYEGLLFSQEAPGSGVWEADTPYNPDYIGGKQFFATVDGGIIELTGPFTIKTMETKDGSTVQTTTVQKYVYQSGTNTTEYAELQAELSALRQQIENLEPTASGGGATTGGSDFLDWSFMGIDAEIVVAAAAVALGALYLREGQH